MSYTDMLATFFCHDGGETQKWRPKGHAEKESRRWMASWAVMLRKPSDLGYDDTGYDPRTISSGVRFSLLRAIGTRPMICRYTSRRTHGVLHMPMRARHYGAASFPQTESLFFSQSPQPAFLYIGRWAQFATNGILHGGAMTPTMQLTGEESAMTRRMAKILGAAIALGFGLETSFAPGVMSEAFAFGAVISAAVISAVSAAVTSGGRSFRGVPCKGISLDCAKEFGCISSPALPAPSTALGSPTVYGRVAYCRLPLRELGCRSNPISSPLQPTASPLNQPKHAYAFGSAVRRIQRDCKHPFSSAKARPG